MSNSTLNFFNTLLPDTVTFNVSRGSGERDQPTDQFSGLPSYFNTNVFNSTPSTPPTINLGAGSNGANGANDSTDTWNWDAWCVDTDSGLPNLSNGSFINYNARVYSTYTPKTDVNAFTALGGVVSPLSMIDANNDGYADRLQALNWLFNFVIEDANKYTTGSDSGYSFDITNDSTVNPVQFNVATTQLAIWTLLGQSYNTDPNDDFFGMIAPNPTLATQLVNYVLTGVGDANGNGTVDSLEFIPDPAKGQTAATIFAPINDTTGQLDPTKQAIVIEVPVIAPPPPPPQPTTVTIGGYKWLDTDTKGDWNSDETGLAGWKIYLDDDTNATNGFLASATTDANGFYSLSLGSFTGAIAKTFYIYENNLDGWTNSYNGATRLDVTTGLNALTGVTSISRVVINNGTPITDPGLIPAALNGANGIAESLNFGNYFSISGSKFVDANGDGSIAGDSKLATTPVTIGLYAWGDANSDGKVQGGELTFLQNTSTVNGDYRFTGLGFLEEGFKYYVQEQVPAGWTQTFGKDGYVIDPTAGAGATGNNFANFQDFLIKGTKYLDANGDGLTTGDVGLGNVTIYIDANNNASLDSGERSTTTDANGNWSLAGLTPDFIGKVVREVVPSGYTPTLGGNGLTITNPGSGGTLSGLDFANKPLGGDLKITKTDGLDCIKPGSRLTYTIVVSNTGQGTATNAVVRDNISPLLTNVSWTSVASGGASGNDNGTGNTLNDVVTLVGGSSITYTVTGTVAANALPPTGHTSASFNLQGTDPTSGSYGNSRTFTAGGVTATARAFNLNNGSWTTAYLGRYGGGLGVTNRNEGTGSNNTHVTDNVGSVDYIALEFDQEIAIDKASLGYVVGDSDFRYWVGTSTSPITTTNIASVLSRAALTEVNDGGGSARTANINSNNVVGNFFVIAARPDQCDDGFKVRSLDILKPNAPSSVILSNTATVSAPDGFIDSDLSNNSATDTTIIQSPTRPPSCQEIVYKFEGNSALCGSYGNIRHFSQNGVNVQASAFSRNTTSGWQNAYLGLFGQGLGVTNRHEGDGGNGNHRVDNGGSQDYILFKFSDSVRVDRAYLNSVVGDSDITVWFGNSNATSVNDSLLNSLVREDNNTTSSSARWADFNAQQLWGNTLVIGASISDSTPDDHFKVGFLDICAIGSSYTPPIC